MAKVIYKMLPWSTNTFGPMRKSIIWVKIDPWPRFGHIFVHSTFSKLPKITWKWRISIESQAGSISYQKALAKGQREIPILALFAMRSPCWTGRISLKFYEIPPEKKGGSHKYIRKSEHMLYFRWKKVNNNFCWFLANFVHLEKMSQILAEFSDF